MPSRMECPRCFEQVMVMNADDGPAPKKHFLKGTNDECTGCNHKWEGLNAVLGPFTCTVCGATR